MLFQSNKNPNPSDAKITYDYGTDWSKITKFFQTNKNLSPDYKPPTVVLSGV
jgi:hypothetical protein